jgi:hypothetical protein
LTFFFCSYSSSDDKDKFLPLSLEALIQRDFEEYEKKKKAADDITTTTVEEKSADGTITTTTTTTTTKVETVVVNKTAAAAASATTPTTPTTNTKPDSDLIPDKSATADVSETSSSGTSTAPASPNADPRIINERYARQRKQRGYNYGDEVAAESKNEGEKGKVAIPYDDPNSVYVGLRVYTHKDVPAVVVGKLKVDSEKEVLAQRVESTEVKAA